MSTTSRHTEPHSTTPFTSLPTEIHLAIADCLELNDIWSLVHVSKAVNTSYTSSLYSSAVHQLTAETKRFFNDDMYWAGDYLTPVARRLSQKGTCEQVHKFLDLFEVQAAHTDWGVPPVDMPFTSEPEIRIPLAMLRTALDIDGRLDLQFIDSLSKRLGPKMNEPGWTPVQSILETPTLIPLGIADVLVRNGMAVNLLFDNFTQPLQAAIIKTEVSVVKWLVSSAGADVNVLDGFGWSPVNTLLGSLWQSSSREDYVDRKMEILRFLVEEAGADVDGAPGKKKAFVQLSEQVQHWLRGTAGAKIEIQKRGCRILKACLPLLIQLKADPDVFPNHTFGGGPLHWVCDDRHRFEPGGAREALVRALIKLGARLELKDELGETPLLKAMNSAKAAVMDPIIRTLIKHKADVRKMDRRGESAVEMARRRGRGDLVEEMRLVGLGVWDDSD